MSTQENRRPSDHV